MRKTEMLIRLPQTKLHLSWYKIAKHFFLTNTISHQILADKCVTLKVGFQNKKKRHENKTQ